jgi:hypothetical protein
MPRLSEIFLRSAFRAGADRSLELSQGGSGDGSFFAGMSWPPVLEGAHFEQAITTADQDFPHVGFAIGSLIDADAYDIYGYGLWVGVRDAPGSQAAELTGTTSQVELSGAGVFATGIEGGATAFDGSSASLATGITGRASCRGGALTELRGAFSEAIVLDGSAGTVIGCYAGGSVFAGTVTDDLTGVVAHTHASVLVPRSIGVHISGVTASATARFGLLDESDAPSQFSDDVIFDEVGKGPVIKSPDGTKYRVHVANGGVLSTEAA